jgi:hypothetical protein
MLYPSLWICVLFYFYFLFNHWRDPFLLWKSTWHSPTAASTHVPLSLLLIWCWRWLRERSVSSQVIIEPPCCLFPWIVGGSEWDECCVYSRLLYSIYEQKKLSVLLSLHTETSKANTCLEPAACNEHQWSGWGYKSALCLPWWYTQDQWDRGLLVSLCVDFSCFS